MNENCPVDVLLRTRLCPAFAGGVTTCVKSARPLLVDFRKISKVSRSLAHAKLAVNAQVAKAKLTRCIAVDK